MTERYVHYHKNGTVTARLEIVRPDDTAAAKEFITCHSERVKESFDGEISAAADSSFERMCARDRAYRYRPCVIRIEYTVTEKKRSAVVEVMIVCVSGRRAVYTSTERHRFRVLRETVLYLGAER